MSSCLTLCNTLRSIAGLPDKYPSVCPFLSNSHVFFFSFFQFCIVPKLSSEVSFLNSLVEICLKASWPGGCGHSQLMLYWVDKWCVDSAWLAAIWQRVSHLVVLSEDSALKQICVFHVVLSSRSRTPMLIRSNTRNACGISLQHVSSNRWIFYDILLYVDFSSAANCGVYGPWGWAQAATLLSAKVGGNGSLRCLGAFKTVPSVCCLVLSV